MGQQSNCPTAHTSGDVYLTEWLSTSNIIKILNYPLWKIKYLTEINVTALPLIQMDMPNSHMQLSFKYKHES